MCGRSKLPGGSLENGWTERGKAGYYYSSRRDEMDDETGSDKSSLLIFFPSLLLRLEPS